MAKRILLFASILMSFCTNVIASTVFNVKDYGAKGNGTDIDGYSINKAIEAASDKGGGTVYLPAGQYACLSVRLASNIRP